MTTPKATNVRIEILIAQVVDGRHYIGRIKIGETVLSYDLRFSIPIPEFDEIEPAPETAELRKLIELNLTKNNVAVAKLTDDEYNIFGQLLGNEILGFYWDSRIRQTNESSGLLSQTIQGKSHLSVAGISVSPGKKLVYTIDFPPQDCEILSDPKFGCQFPD